MVTHVFYILGKWSNLTHFFQKWGWFNHQSQNGIPLAMLRCARMMCSMYPATVSTPSALPISNKNPFHEELRGKGVYRDIYAQGMHQKRSVIYMGVSKNGGTPKSSILIGFSIINHPFGGTPIFGNIHIFLSFWTYFLKISFYRWLSIFILIYTGSGDRFMHRSVSKAGFANQHPKSRT